MTAKLLDKCTKAGVKIIFPSNLNMEIIKLHGTKRCIQIHSSLIVGKKILAKPY